jgi:[histone H3]-lysine27 N-trimethyltransferase EZH2
VSPLRKSFIALSFLTSNRRECDPNLCHSCGAAIHPYLRQPYCQFITTSQQPSQYTPKIDELASVDPRLDRKYCQNTRLTLGHGKKVAMGRSSIHGWGLFLREDVKKGDFIMEYKGEIISQDEAERRGKLFDKIDSSFLFNLSTEYVIDATRKGSKAKFANHSKDDPNCGPRIKLVQGDHRIGIFALKNMPSGTELTFDYLYAGEEAPRWACKSAKRNDFLL